MAATVKVKVTVDDSALNSLENRINGLDGSTINLGKSSASAASGINKLNDSTKQAAKSTSTLWTNVGKFAQWYVIGGAVSAVTDAVKSGIGEIKNLDTALVDINKVMEVSDKQLKQYSKDALELGKNYGIAASDIASSMADWARAGFDNITEMAELSSLLQKVGDISAETATNMLVGVNAAYKLNGSYKDLMLVIDKLNYVDNNFATTVEDLAVGMPIVANTAATLGMSFDELTVALGTLNAATQASPSKIATALRAILLNIAGDTAQIQEDIVNGLEADFIYTEGEIKAINGLINKYAPEVVAAAEATGQLIDPWEAITALQNAYQEGLLTDTELYETLYDLSGKLRYEFLAALVTQKALSDEMIEGMKGAGGSAQKELEKVMQSWQNKTEVLNNTWTDFLSNFVDTDLVKEFLDAAVSGVEMLDSIASTIDAPLSNAFDIIGDIFSTVDALSSSIGLVADGFANWDFSGVRDGLNEIFSDWEDSVFGGGGEQEAIEVPVTVDSSEVDSYEPDEKESEAAYSVDSSAVDAWTPPTKYGTAIYTAKAAMATGGVAAGGQTLVNEVGAELISDNGKAYVANGGKPAIVNLHKGAYVFNADETKALLSSSTLGSKSIPAYKSGTLGGIIGNTIQSTVGIAKAVGGAVANVLGEGIKSAAGMANAIVTSVFPSSSSSKSSSSSSGGSVNKPTGVSAPAQYTWSDGKVHSYAEPTGNSGSGYSGGGNGGGSSAPTKPNYNYEDLEKTLKEELSNLNELAEWYDNKAEHSTEADTYQQAIDKIAELRDKYLEGGYEETAPEVVKLANDIYDYEEKKSKAEKHAYEDLEDTLDATLDTLDAQIELAENIGDINKAIDLQIKAQEAIAKAIADAKAMGYAENSQEVLDLMNKGYDYANDVNKSKETLWGNLVDAIQAIKDTVDDANDLAERETAVEEARLAYEKAQSQRNVRIFNSATGQWEWIANQGQVSSAQKSYEDAQKSLQDYQTTQAINALKNGSNLSDILLSEGLSTLLASGDASQTAAVATALGLLTGGVDKSPSAKTKGLFNTDSHDTITQYAFNGVSISEAVAKSMTLADLAAQLSILNLTTQMPS